MRPRLRIVSYNIHKGFSAGGGSYVLDGIKAAIAELQPDILFVQEILGHEHGAATRKKGLPTESQLERLADTSWPHFAYGKNAVYPKGHHGNAILSRFPILSWQNQDVSPSRWEKRGILHARVAIPGHPIPMELLCLHLALRERDRLRQLKALSDRLRTQVPLESPTVVAGDFNDWRTTASRILRDEAGLEEAFLKCEGRHARTFPSLWPMLSLDRIYYRGLTPHVAHCPSGKNWKALSDHLPLLAELELP